MILFHLLGERSSSGGNLVAGEQFTDSRALRQGYCPAISRKRTGTVSEDYRKKWREIENMKPAAMIIFVASGEFSFLANNAASLSSAPI